MDLCRKDDLNDVSNIYQRLQLLFHRLVIAEVFEFSIHRLLNEKLLSLYLKKFVASFHNTAENIVYLLGNWFVASLPFLTCPSTYNFSIKWFLLQFCSHLKLNDFPLGSLFVFVS